MNTTSRFTISLLIVGVLAVQTRAAQPQLPAPERFAGAGTADVASAADSMSIRC